MSKQNPTQLDMWKDDGEDISLKTMDDAVKLLRQAKEVYDEASAVSKDCYKRYQEVQGVVIQLLERAGKDKYIVEGAGTVSVKDVLSVTTPKSPAQKQAFFNWVKEFMGEDAYYSYMSVNSISLNSLYKTKVEEYGTRGEVLRIDGIDEPTSYKKLSFTKK